MPQVEELPSGRFRVRWFDAAGNRHSPPRITFPTKSAARAYGRDREAEIRRGDYRDPRAGQMLLRDWIAQWSESRIGEDRTLGEERGTIDRYLLKGIGGAKPLGDLTLDAIDELVVQAWVKRLEGAGLSASSVLRYYRVLSAVLRPAIRTRRIPVDPLTDIRLPAMEPPDDFFWERDEIDAVRQQWTDPLDLALFEFLIGTGARWGEAVGLHLPRWQPLRRRVVFRDVLVERAGFRLKYYTKGKSRREVPVSPDLVEAMAAHLAVNPPIDCGLSHGKGRTCPGLVFHRAGRPISRFGWPGGAFAEAVAAATVTRPRTDGRGDETVAVRRGTVHQLRHTYASWLVIDGVAIRVVQELLGHASVQTTERYSHLAPSAIDDPKIMASLVGRIVGSTSTGTS